MSKYIRSLSEGRALEMYGTTSRNTLSCDRGLLSTSESTGRLKFNAKFWPKAVRLSPRYEGGKERVTR